MGSRQVGLYSMCSQPKNLTGELGAGAIPACCAGWVTRLGWTNGEVRGDWVGVRRKRVRRHGPSTHTKKSALVENGKGIIQKRAGDPDKHLKTPCLQSSRGDTERANSVGRRNQLNQEQKFLEWSWKKKTLRRRSPTPGGCTQESNRSSGW